ncbi:MAG: glycosyltransferase family 9 protein [Candidatus Margulisbacteria bacterium]|nr:glycosyltransferase family 9 protein [Candidatus Margulisiibacteriota bacterium]MBU1616595.1 glycosyltransferase family 9 protein [Candidatus Margulisiibacteriota bacterium]MBU1867465.1 glycosyltransferase family 9 protein [Candidatus Margulisiibacteriota bacterium]
MVKILIVKLGAIGDVLRTTSLLPGLHDKFNRQATIDWLTSGSAKDILLNNQLISRLAIWEERGELNDYKLIIGLEDDKKACEYVASRQVEQVVGAYLKNGRQTYTTSGWFDMSMISRFGLEQANVLKKRNQNTYQQHMAALLGIEISPYVFNLKPEEREYGEKVIRGLGIGKSETVVGINTGAGKRWPLKSWGVGRTIDLVMRLRKELGVVSLILGGEQEQERNALIAKETDMPSAGSHSLRGFAAVIDQTKALVSSDSLAMHFGVALKKRLVIFFGPTSAAEIELYGLGEKLLAPIDCAVCYKKKCEKKPNCMDLVSVDEMFQAMKRQLASI